MNAPVTERADVARRRLPRHRRSPALSKRNFPCAPRHTRERGSHAPPHASHENGFSHVLREQRGHGRARRAEDDARALPRARRRAGPNHREADARGQGRERRLGEERGDAGREEGSAPEVPQAHQQDEEIHVPRRGQLVSGGDGRSDRGVPADEQEQKVHAEENLLRRGMRRGVRRAPGDATAFSSGEGSAVLEGRVI
eukprot:30342-Pelagococcus_subviridis.AAC.8